MLLADTIGLDLAALVLAGAIPPAEDEVIKFWEFLIMYRRQFRVWYIKTPGEKGEKNWLTVLLP